MTLVALNEGMDGSADVDNCLISIQHPSSHLAINSLVLVSEILIEEKKRAECETFCDCLVMLFYQSSNLGFSASV